MKKLISIMAAAFVALSGLMMTSCTEDEVNAIMGPTDTWCTIPITKGSGDSETLLGYASIIYSENGYTSTSIADGYLAKNTSIKPGITVAVWRASSTSDESLVGTVLSGLTSSGYVLKTFSKDGTEAKDGDSDTEGITIKGTKEKFTAIYLAKPDMRKAENQKKLPQAPTALANGGKEPLTLENFSWKSLLKSYLISSL